MKDDPKREERPRQAARLITKINDESKDTTSPVLVDRSLAVGRLARWAARGTA
jgi:hypothetical protein